MQPYLAIALGGALGSVLRFAMNEAVSARFGRAFPWGTLSINVIGSFLIGLLAVLLIERWDVSPALRLGLMVGVLGGFTTFSSFSLEVVNLAQNGALLRATLYVLASVSVCVLAAAAGIHLARTSLGMP
ncbi:fluoride efflux transporter CrcB [Thioalkalivibrio sp.]|uniref:fluoride efflux transporter CrcB n=1 Tax=Thioalkalivibrio sp. TaxID=2093813 RepID=UPI00356450BF